jgi:hypothetical protein
MQRINKSLDKIKQIFMHGNPISPTNSNQPPMTSKNSQNNQKANEILSKITNYQSFIKKAKVEKEQSSVRSSKPSKNAVPAKGKREAMASENNPLAKKSTENFKKYLSGSNVAGGT